MSAVRRLAPVPTRSILLSVLEPGLSLFRSLRLRAKAAVIATVLLLPTLVLGTLAIDRLRQDIGRADRARLGVAEMGVYVNLSERVVSQLALQQADQAEAAVGGATGGAAAWPSPDEIVENLGDWRRRLIRRGDALDLRPALDTLEQATSGGGDDVIAALAALRQRIEDGSGLALQSTPETRHLIHTLVRTLPGAAVDVGRVWGWTSYGVAKGGLDNPAQYRRAAVWNARADGVLEDALSNLALANSGAEGATGPEIDAAGLVDVRRYLAGADTTELVKAAMTAEEARNAGARASADLHETWRALLPRLDDRLAAQAEALKSHRRLLLAVIGLAALVAGYLLWCFWQVTNDGMQLAVSQLDRLADGDLSGAIPIVGRDETAQLLTALARTKASVGKIVRDVHEACDMLVHASGEIAFGSNELSDRTERTAAELQRTAAALQRIDATLDHSSATTGRAVTMAAENAEAARRGGEVIGDAVMTMGGISNASRRIGEIIGVIDSIAFQTNLLALNAAVEAARAGDQGRGFAVVATEVRMLARRSSEAAREIKQLIHETSDQIDDGVQVVNDAGAQMRSLVDGARGIDDMLTSISASAEQQGSGVRAVNQAVEALDAMTRQNTTLVGDAAAAAATLRERSQALLLAISRFRL